jgi:hypothetical protein
MNEMMVDKLNGIPGPPPYAIVQRVKTIPIAN